MERGCSQASQLCLVVPLKWCEVHGGNSCSIRMYLSANHDSAQYSQHQMVHEREKKVLSGTAMNPMPRLPILHHMLVDPLEQNFHSIVQKKLLFHKRYGEYEQAGGSPALTYIFAFPQGDRPEARGNRAPNSWLFLSLSTYGDCRKRREAIIRRNLIKQLKIKRIDYQRQCLIDCTHLESE